MKKILFVIILILMVGCDNKDKKNNTNQIFYQYVIPTTWQGDKEWEINDDGDFHGNYEGFYRIYISLAAKNYTYTTGKQDNFSSMVIEMYKKNLQSKIYYKLYLLRFGYGKHSNKISIKFDGNESKTYNVEIKYNNEITFMQNDTLELINKIKSSKNFIVEYQDEKSFFINNDFPKALSIGK